MKYGLAKVTHINVKGFKVTLSPHEVFKPDEMQDLENIEDDTGLVTFFKKCS